MNLSISNTELADNITLSTLVPDLRTNNVEVR